VSRGILQALGHGAARHLRKAVTFMALGTAVVLAAPRAEAGYAAIVVDAETGAVLHEANADVLNFPASLTKMMTLYLAFDALKRGDLAINERMPVSATAAAQPPTKLGLPKGATIDVETAILALITKSANDISVVLAERLGGSVDRFADQMTAKARKLGMASTRFQNPHGLPNAGQVTTARDLSVLAIALQRDHGEFYHYFSTPSLRFGGRVLPNHNRLMARYPGMDGLKTGYTNASGFNLAASARRDGRRLVAVVMGGKTAAWRDNRMESLLNAAFGVGSAGSALIASAEPEAKPAAKTARSSTKKTTVAKAAPKTTKKAPVQVAKASTKTKAKPPVQIAEGDSDVANAKASGGWAIQVGAYNDRKAGQAALAKLTGIAGTPKLVPSSNGKVYRARFVGLSQEAARSACAKLEKKGTDCMTMRAS